MSVTQIVLTGGPCGGKTTSLSYITEKLTQLGYRVLIAPEMATLLMQGGINFGGLEKKEFLQMQKANLELQKDVTNRLKKLANSLEGKVVIIYDRSFMDAQVYVSKDEFNALLTELELDLWQARDQFDAVIHLTSTAVDAPKFYTLENNNARRETVEQASEADKATRDVWVGTQHHRVIPNSGGFEEKLEHALKEILHVLGEPESLEIENKYLLSSVPDFDTLDVPYQKIELSQTYLNWDEEGVEVRVRQQKGSDYSVFFLTQKKPHPLKKGTRFETQELISQTRYYELLKQADPTRKTVHKTRYIFLYQNQYFELDVFKDIDLVLCEIELSDPEQTVDLPAFLSIVREVTNDPEFKNSNIAKMISQL